MKNDKLAIIGTLLISIFGIIIVGIVVIAEKDRLNKKLQDKQDIIESQAELLIEKQRTIESQADMLIERDKEACPEWLEDFYYDHVCDYDGCEVRE